MARGRVPIPLVASGRGPAPQNDSGRGPQQTSLKTIVHRIGSVSVGSRLSRVILSVSEESRGSFLLANKNSSNNGTRY
ncbi:protein of unknown function [Nitrospina watsonii]|uniref:Uncharacterized protein n=1 Tax=Nitrospina watsonii TaxID=1323948 RepID=A0ABM9HHF4_9BACT|nr:protein of unknown function [Nitrospina watsonii]